MNKLSHDFVFRRTCSSRSNNILPVQEAASSPIKKKKKSECAAADEEAAWGGERVRLPARKRRGASASPPAWGRRGRGFRRSRTLYTHTPFKGIFQHPGGADLGRGFRRSGTAFLGCFRCSSRQRRQSSASASSLWATARQGPELGAGGGGVGLGAGGGRGRRRVVAGHGDELPLQRKIRTEMQDGFYKLLLQGTIIYYYLQARCIL
ncbi:unnamed protein product [Urochloa humidicola]